jgi:hypothetical protein
MLLDLGSEWLNQLELVVLQRVLGHIKGGYPLRGLFSYLFTLKHKHQSFYLFNALYESGNQLVRLDLAQICH